MLLRTDTRTEEKRKDMVVHKGMKCLYCKEEFIPLTINQKYCSRICGYKFRKNYNVEKDYPSITFSCAKCGRVVVTEPGTKDKRTRFCSSVCEKKYWRHPPWEHKSNLSNFHSMEEYLGYEKRRNE